MQPLFVTTGLLLLFVTTSLATTIQVASTHLTPPPPMPSIQPQPLFVTSLVTTSMQPPMQPLLATTSLVTTSTQPPMQPLLATTIQVASTHLKRDLSTAAPHVASRYVTPASMQPPPLPSALHVALWYVTRTTMASKMLSEAQPHPTLLQRPLLLPAYLRGEQLADTSMCSHSLKSLPNQWSLPKPRFQLLEALNFMS